MKHVNNWVSVEVNNVYFIVIKDRTLAVTNNGYVCTIKHFDSDHMSK